MADVCELAHRWTIKECNEKGIRHTIDINFGMETKYTDKAQKIFDKHYDHIIEVTKI